MSSHSKSRREYVCAVTYERLAEGGYQVIVPAAPEIITSGRTLDEAREMARDAIVCHVRGLLKDGEPVPAGIRVKERPVTRSGGRP